MTKSKLHAPKTADVKLILDGEELTLKPTLDACLGISRLHNSPMITAGKITDMDFDTILHVLALGIGVQPDRKLQDRLFKSGLLDIRTPLIEFIHVVNNGGRPVELIEQDGEEDNPL